MRLRPSTNDDDLPQDLSFLIGSIRSRQNALFFFLQGIKMQRTVLRAFQQETNKELFIQKQKLLTIQINKVLQRHIQSIVQRRSLKLFWSRLKIILKSSFDKLLQLQVITQPLQLLYQQLILALSQQAMPLTYFSVIQKMLKKRTLCVLVSKQLLQKNKSEKDIEHDKSNKKKEKIAMQFQANLLWLEKPIYQVVRGRYECNYDKKKTLAQNITCLYEELIGKNAANQKAILKHSLKIARFVPLKKKNSHHKQNFIRAKTTIKQTKRVMSKIQK